MQVGSLDEALENQQYQLERKMKWDRMKKSMAMLSMPVTAIQQFFNEEEQRKRRVIQEPVCKNQSK